MEFKEVGMRARKRVELQKWVDDYHTSGIADKLLAAVNKEMFQMAGAEKKYWIVELDFGMSFVDFDTKEEVQKFLSCIYEQDSSDDDDRDYQNRKDEGKDEGKNEGKERCLQIVAHPKYPQILIDKSRPNQLLILSDAALMHT